MNVKPLAIVPLRTAGQITSPPNNLPAQLTSLVGRDEEVSTLEQLLQLPDVRLVTLTGPGGVGKTRLSLQIAQELLSRFESGVFFVDLTFITETERVPSAIAQVLGLKDSEGSPLELLVENLRDSTALLLLDNFEQVLDAAPYVSELLEECPGLKMLVTSRAALHLRGEHEFEVQPLSLPARDQFNDLEAIAGAAAVALFVKRAAAIKHDFNLTTANAPTVAQICARLDGLPLALELAATQIKMLTPQAMLARLDRRLALLTSGTRDMPARHRTLRATIEWSYSLLPDDERRLFRLLSGFAGGATLEAIETLSASWRSAEDGPTDNGSTLGTVGALIDKSMLRQTAQEGEPRYSMLETLREYGVEQLTALDEMEELRRAHAGYYLRLAEEWEPDLAGPRQGELMDRLEQEHDNMRAALNWAVGRVETELALRLSVALWWFWRVRGYATEGRRWLGAALELPINAPAGSESDAKIKLNRIHAHNAAGVLAYEQGDYEQAIKFHEGTLALGREIGRRGSIAAALNNLGLVARGQGDYLKARTLYEESLALHTEVGKETQDRKWSIAISLNNLGVVAVELGEYEKARSLHEEGLVMRREVGDKRGIAMGLHNLGYVLALQGNYDEARALQEESMGLHREVGNNAGVAYALAALGNIDLSTGKVADALENYMEAMELRLALGDKEGIADALDGLAAVAAATGQNELAARLLGTASSLRESTGLHIAPTIRNFYERTLNAVREKLGERRFKAAWHEGRGMSPQQVLTSETIVLAQGAIDSTPSQPQQTRPVQSTTAVVAPDQEEFAGAVQEALKHLTRTATLESNLLVNTAMVSARSGGGAGIAKRVSTLQWVVKEAVAALQNAPRDLKLYRAVFHTYVQPAPTQEQAAELLDLPFSTYRRHLKEGVGRVTETLWQWEREAREA